MKISLLITAIMLGIAALFILPRQNELKFLTTEWTDLEDRALALGVPTDHRAPFSSDRIRTGGIRAARAEKVAVLADQIIDIFNKMTELAKSGGKQSEIETEFAILQGRLAGFDSDELRLLVKAISADTTLETKSKPGIIGFVVMGLAAENPAEALAITMDASGSPDAMGAGNGRAIQGILGLYAQKDPVAAAQWLGDHKEAIGKMDESEKKWLIQSAAKKDLGAALSFIDSLQPEKNSGIFFGLASGVTSENADIFLAAIRDRTTDPAQRKSAFGGLVNSQLMMNFEAGTTWLEKSDFTEEERKDLFSTLSDFALWDQPGKWLEWIENQEKVEGFNPSYATKSIIERWTMENFAATGEWINTQPDGLQKNQATQTYAETLAPLEPEAAADWAGTLPEGKERTRIFEKIHRSLTEKDPAAATAFAEKYSLKPE